MLRTMHVWMLLQKVFGEIIIKDLLVLKCLTHMDQVAEALIYLRKLEREKQKKYEQHIREVEMGCFIEDLPYCTVMSWLRCHVSFCYIDFTSLRSKVF